MIKGTVIKLSKTLLDEAYELGRARYENNRQNGVLRNDISGVDPVISDCEGVAGELAFAQMVDADTTETKRIGLTSSEQGTDTGDVHFNGLNIDVKTTKYASGHLLVYKHKLDNTNVDGYALITGWHGQYVFRGYISKEAIKTGGFPTLSKNTLWVHQDALKDLPEMHADIQLDDEARLIDGCDCAIIGDCDGLAVYSYDLLIDCFTKQLGNEEEAIEWLNFNVIGACIENAPLIINLTAPQGGVHKIC